MFICGKCLVKKNILMPLLPSSYGRCEECHSTKDCYDTELPEYVDIFGKKED